MRTDTQSEVIAFLSRGATYGMPHVRVTRIETHCSIIFLAGPYAYKLKRPVAFSSLDFRTVERRGVACRAELALNRRTAPELYLAVHSICRSPSGGLEIDGRGEVVDWLVAMRRFAQVDIFAHLADRSLLSPALMDALAIEIAEFHRTAEPIPNAGGAATLAAAIEHNDRDLQTVSKILPLEAVADLRGRSLNLLEELKPILNRRGQQGKIRQCHGDLRLANITLVDGRPTLFDAIEFNEGVARIDVLFDLAFLLMELCHRECKVFGNIVFNRYLDETANDDGSAALGLMLSIRAANRAYSLALAVERQREGQQSERMELSAKAHMALAGSFLMQSPSRLLVIGGLSSSYKSAVAHELAARCAPAPGARILRSDAVRKKILGLAERSRLPPSAYTAELNAGVYGAIYDEAKRLLGLGCSVVIDASFMERHHRAAVAAVASSLAVPYVGLWLGAVDDMEIDEADPSTKWPALALLPTPAATVEKALEWFAERMP